MFQGEKVVRFFSHTRETVVLRTVQEALAGLGQVTMDRGGGIRIAAGRDFRSTWTETSLSGRLRRRNREYEVRIAYQCRPTPAAWTVAALGTLPLLCGWVAILASWSARRRVAVVVRRTLRDLSNQPEETPDEEAYLENSSRRRTSGRPCTVARAG